MKKTLALALILALGAAAFTACTDKTPAGTEIAPETEVTEESEETEETGTEDEEAPVEETEDEASEEEAVVMTYEEFADAEIDAPVCVETYVQAKQGWWENNGLGVATVYTQNEEAAYFLYNMLCPEEDYDKLVPGTKIKVMGFKAEWSGEVEIADATFEIEEGEYIAEAKDVTELLGTDALIDDQNKFVAFKGMTVEAANDDGDAFLYNWDGSGEEGNDLYFNVSYNGETYSFVVESYLTGPGTDVYEAVKALKVGDVVDMEGFLYWYEGVNPHITSVSVVEG